MPLDKVKQLSARVQLSSEIMAFQKGKKDVVLELATGIGKSFNFLNIVRNHKHDRVLFVVPQSPMIDNFIEDVHKLGFSSLLKNFKIICYASLQKYVGQYFDVIGFDEAHSLFSDARMSYIKEISASKRVLLSATLDDTVKQQLSNEFDLHNTFVCTYYDGVRRGILPELQMEIHSIYLDDVNKVWPHKFKGQKSETLLTGLEYYRVLDKKVKDAVEKWNNRNEFKGNPMWLHNRMLRAGGERQTWVGEYKTEFIRQTIESLGNSRMVVFCASKSQANLLGGDDAVSSDNTKTVNRNIIKDFNDGKSNRIFAKNMLIEGMNLKDTPYAIVAGLGSKELKAVQQIGRVLRHDEPMMYILVVAGTVDEKFLEKSFKVNIYGERI